MGSSPIYCFIVISGRGKGSDHFVEEGRDTLAQANCVVDTERVAGGHSQLTLRASGKERRLDRHREAGCNLKIASRGVTRGEQGREQRFTRQSGQVALAETDDRTRQNPAYITITLGSGVAAAQKSLELLGPVRIWPPHLPA